LSSDQQPINHSLSYNKKLIRGKPFHLCNAVANLPLLIQVKQDNERIASTENKNMGEELYRLLFACVDDCSALPAFLPLHIFLCSK